MTDWTKIAAYLLTPPERTRFVEAESHRAYGEYLGQQVQYLRRWFCDPQDSQ
jgi:hypothetical protein